MVIREPFSPALVHAIGGADPDRHRLSRTASIAIGVSIAAHLALGFYLYEAKYVIPAPPVTAADPNTGVVLIPDVSLQPKPNQKVAHALAPRPTPTPVRTLTDTLPLRPT